MKHRLGVLAGLVVTVLTAALLVSPGGAGAVQSQSVARLAATAVAASDGYSPTPRALFGRPGSNGIRSAVLQAIRHTPRGHSIRMAAWALSDYAVTDALIDAKRRGVTVRAIISYASRDYGAAKRLKNALGSNMRISRGAARKASRLPGGAMHQKTYTFSRTGGQPYVTIITSANPTQNATAAQYNDGWQFVNYKAAYDRVNGIFAEMFRGVTLYSPFRHYNLSPNTALTFNPWNYASMKDPVVSRIENLPNRNLVIRVANAAWSGGRGQGIARALARKKAGGANIYVVHGAPFGAAVRDILVKARIPMRKAHWGDSRYLHGKFMTASWTTDGVRKVRVWTGSENWGDAPRASDEIVAKIGNKGGYDAFQRWWSYLWSIGY